MLKTKKDIDAHVHDIFSKLPSDKERSLRCFGVAKSYASIGEIETAKRYLETFISSKPSNIGEAYKLMGDLLLETNDYEKAFTFYKAAYENGKSRVALGHVCDLLHAGYGQSEPNPQRWYDLQKSAPGLNTWLAQNSNGLEKRTTSFSVLSPRVRSPIHNSNESMSTPTTALNISVNGSERQLSTYKSPQLTSTPARIHPSPERVDKIEKKFFEDKFQQLSEHSGDIMGKVCEIMNQLKIVTGENAKVMEKLAAANSEVESLKQEMEAVKTQNQQMCSEFKKQFEAMRNSLGTASRNQVMSSTPEEATKTKASSKSNEILKSEEPSKLDETSKLETPPKPQEPSPFTNFSIKPLSFGGISSSGKNIFATTTYQKPFEGAGAPVFGFPIKPASFPTSEDTQEGEEDVSEEPDAFVPTAEFTPVVPLPPLIEVKRGDEEDDTIFETRAKVFRFDKDVKDWKERGLGNIKIVRNKTDNSKVRVLLWREKVLKLACNHFIKKDMEITNRTDKHLTWMALDYSEDEVNMEKFLVKFSNEKACSEFKKQFEAMRNSLGTTSSNQVMSSIPGEATKTKASSKSEEPSKLDETSKSETQDICIQACSGCEGCEPDTFNFELLSNRKLPLYPEQNMTIEEFLKQQS